MVVVAYWVFLRALSIAVITAILIFSASMSSGCSLFSFSSRAAFCISSVCTRSCSFSNIESILSHHGCRAVCTDACILDIIVAVFIGGASSSAVDPAGAERITPVVPVLVSDPRRLFFILYIMKFGALFLMYGT